MTATTALEGKKMVFNERFVSPGEFDKKEDALRVLEEIRKAHPAEDGWVETYGDAEYSPDTGKLYAVRRHQKYE